MSFHWRRHGCGQSVIRKLCLIAALRTAFSVVASAQAQTYPTKYITLVVPFPAGGPPDVNARFVATALSDVLGQQVIVENRSGAAGTIGTAAVARSPPDGYTLMLADITFLVGPSLFANLKYDPLRDFVPVGSLSRANMFLVVNPSFPAKTVSDLVAMAKQRPGELQYVNPGLGTPPHLAALAFTRATGTVMAPIFYRGAGPAVADLVAGHVPIIFLGLSASAPQVQSGKLRALAVTGRQRVAEFSDIPTFRESGVDLEGLEDGAWFGTVAPTGTPVAIIEKLNSAVNQVLLARTPVLHLRPRRSRRSSVERPWSSVLFSEHSRNFGARRLRPPECIQTDTRKCNGDLFAQPFAIQTTTKTNRAASI